MKIMVVWKTVPGQYKTAFDQFLKSRRSGPGWRDDLGAVAHAGFDSGLAFN